MVRLFDSFHDAEHIFLIMDYVDGGDLYDHVSKQPESRLSIPVVGYALLVFIDTLLSSSHRSCAIYVGRSASSLRKWC